MKKGAFATLGLCIVGAVSWWLLQPFFVTSDPAVSGLEPTNISTIVGSSDVILTRPDVPISSVPAMSEAPQAVRIAVEDGTEAAPTAGEVPGTPADASLIQDDVARLSAERDRLRRLLHELSEPTLRDQLDRGTAEFLGQTSSYTHTKSDRSLIYRVYMVPERGAFKASVSRSERPDLYGIKDDIDNLDATIRAMRQERLAHAKKVPSYK